MKIGFEQICAATTGAARTINRDGAIEFYRFTEEQESFEKARVDDLYRRSLTTSGVAMYFKTNSKSLSFDITFDPVMKNKPNPYFSFDIFASLSIIQLYVAFFKFFCRFM